MNFEEKLANEVYIAGGVFNDIKWGTMRGQLLTLGTMTNDHLANSRHYHKHLAELARVSPELQVNIEDCLFNEYLMQAAINMRQASGDWDIDLQDFRLQ